MSETRLDGGECACRDRIVGQAGTHQATMSAMAVADLVMDRLDVTTEL